MNPWLTNAWTCSDESPDETRAHGDGPLEGRDTELGVGGSTLAVAVVAGCASTPAWAAGPGAPASETATAEPSTASGAASGPESGPGSARAARAEPMHTVRSKRMPSRKPHLLWLATPIIPPPFRRKRIANG